MRQNVADVNLSAVIMDCGDDPNFVPADIENGELSDLVRVGKHRTQRLD